MPHAYPHTLSAYIKCNNSDKNDVAEEEDNVQLFSNENILKVVQVVIYYSVEKVGNTIKVVHFNSYHLRSGECVVTALILRYIAYI